MSPLIICLFTLLIMELTLKYLEFALEDTQFCGILSLCFVLNREDHVLDLGVRTKVISEVLKFSPTSTELCGTQHFYVISSKVPVTDVDSKAHCTTANPYAMGYAMVHVQDIIKLLIPINSQQPEILSDCVQCGLHKESSGERFPT